MSDAKQPESDTQQPTSEAKQDSMPAWILGVVAVLAGYMILSMYL